MSRVVYLGQNGDCPVTFESCLCQTSVEGWGRGNQMNRHESTMPCPTQPPGAFLMTPVAKNGDTRDKADDCSCGATPHTLQPFSPPKLAFPPLPIVWKHLKSCWIIPHRKPSMLGVPSSSSHSSLLTPARVKTMEPTLVQFLNLQSGNQSDTQTSRGHPPPERARDSSNSRRKRPAKPHLLHTMWLWKHQQEEMRNWMKKGEIRVIGGRGRKWERDREQQCQIKTISFLKRDYGSYRVPANQSSTLLPQVPSKTNQNEGKCGWKRTEKKKCISEGISELVHQIFV